MKTQIRSETFDISKLCECGCGLPVNEGRRFIRTHHLRKFHLGKVPWNKGLTKKTHPSIKATGGNTGKVKYPELSKEILIQLYKVEDLSVSDISKKLNVPGCTLYAYLKRYGLFQSCSPKRKLELVGDNFARCSKCLEVKELVKFYPKNSRWQLSYCRECRATQRRSSPQTVESKLIGRCRHLKKKSAEKHLEFNLTEDFLISLYNKQNGKCFYSGSDMLLRGTSKDKDKSLSVDRMDNSKGYLTDNVVLCCNKMNNVKNNLSLKELRELIPTWYKKIEDYKNGTN